MTMANLIRSDTCYGFAHPSGGRHTLERARVAAHQDHAVGVPCGAHQYAVCKVRECLHRAAGHVEAFQLTVCEEPEGSAV